MPHWRDEIMSDEYDYISLFETARRIMKGDIVPPQVEKPVETSVAPLNVETFRVPGASIGAGTGKVTNIDGVDPDGASITGMGGPKKEEKQEDKRLDFCVLSVHKSELEKKDKQ